MGWSCISDSNKAVGFCDGAIELAYSAHGHWCVPSNVSRVEVKNIIKREIIAAHNGDNNDYDETDLLSLPAHEFINA